MHAFLREYLFQTLPAFSAAGLIVSLQGMESGGQSADNTSYVWFICLSPGLCF